MQGAGAAQELAVVVRQPEPPRDEGRVVPYALDVLGRFVIARLDGMGEACHGLFLGTLGALDRATQLGGPFRDHLLQPLALVALRDFELAADEAQS